MCNDPTRIIVDWSELQHSNEPNILLDNESNECCNDPTKIKVDWGEVKQHG